MEGFPPARALWVAAVGLSILVALVVIALAREPVALEVGSPEGTVQAYLQAVADEDYDSALALLDPQLSARCDGADIRRSLPAEPFTATLDDTSIIDDTATVTVSMGFGPDSGLFGPGPGGYQQFFYLEQSDGEWLITDDAWPYFTWSCEAP